MVTPKIDMPTSCFPEPANVALFGKSVFANVIKDLEMRSSAVIPRGPKSRDKYPYRDNQRRDTQKAICHVKTEEDIETKTHLEPPKAEKASEGFPLVPSERVQLCQQLDFRLLASRSVRK